MNIYLSAGASTIAALMAVDRPGDDRLEQASGVDVAGDGRQMLRCERAVVTAYRDLLRHGTAEAAALRACAVLYRSHHPEASTVGAVDLVAAWLARHGLREAAGRATVPCRASGS